LARLSLELLPDGEAEGLLALTLLHESRRSARTTHDGEMILLEDQDRSLWNRELIAEGIRLLRNAFASRRLGPYTMRAAISALHAEASSSAATHLVRDYCLV
jgi:RNA polymerase sigma-70 factor (ECF subfamily)